MIDLSRKKESRHCIECFRCVNPDSKGGVALRIRRPGEEIEEIAHRSPNMAEIWFFFLGTGIALGGFLWLVIPEYQSWRHGFGAWLLEREWWWALKPGPSWLMVVHPDGEKSSIGSISLPSSPLWWGVDDPDKWNTRRHFWNGRMALRPGRGGWDF